MYRCPGCGATMNTSFCPVCSIPTDESTGQFAQFLRPGARSYTEVAQDLAAIDSDVGPCALSALSKHWEDFYRMLQSDNDRVIPEDAEFIWESNPDDIAFMKKFHIDLRKRQPCSSAKS